MSDSLQTTQGKTIKTNQDGRNPPLADKIMKIDKKKGVSSYYTIRGTLGEQLVNLKDKTKM
jgi:hypothetical protein